VTVTGTLDDIVQRAEAARLEPPVVAVIGPVVRLGARLRRVVENESLVEAEREAVPHG
jgi:siroheme synthase